MTPTIILHHLDLGRMSVSISEDATWWTRRRHWFCPDDPELGVFDDHDFEEAPSTIETKLLAARNSQAAKASEDAAVRATR